MLKKIELTVDNQSMIETFTKPPDTQHVLSLDSETILHTEHELLVPIVEYASREGLSRRTIDRYVEIGRLEKVKKHGQTYILDNPLKPQVKETVSSEKVPDSQIVPFAQADWIRYGSLQTRAKAKTIWQTYAIVVTLLLFAFVLTSLWLFTQWRFLTS